MVIIYNYNVPQPGFNIKSELVYVTLTGVNANAPRQRKSNSASDTHLDLTD